MHRTLKEMKTDINQNMRGGKGSVAMTHILENKEFYGKGRIFAKVTLKPGCSVGLHKHEGDFEAYFVIKGEGMYNDNGNIYPIHVGDLALCDDGQSHGLENTVTEDLEVVALILYTK